MTDKNRKFQQVLDDSHQWPCPYTFKFIVPTGNLHMVEALFPDQELGLRESKSGKYTSITLETTMCSSKDVMAIYEKVATVPGVMSL